MIVQLHGLSDEPVSVRAPGATRSDTPPGTRPNGFASADRLIRRWSGLLFVFSTLLASLGHSSPLERARDIGVPFEGTPGLLNAITDVPGVEVGQVSLISGEGLRQVGIGPVRTGVTIIFPRGRANSQSVYGGFFDLNGTGEMTGLSYLEDFGVIQGPIGITNTNAIGQAYAGIQQWAQQRFGVATWPVVAETYDGRMNDDGGFHVRPETVIAAIEAAKSGPVAEGNVGGGTGMGCFGFKGGIGTASRKIVLGDHAYTVGVLVQCNTGDRRVLRIAGVPVGQELSNRWLPCYDPAVAPNEKRPKCAANAGTGVAPPDVGSIIIVVGTDAPLLPTQLNRVAKRAAMGLARLGSYSGNGSGDLLVAFSTSPAAANDPDQTAPSAINPIANKAIDPLFQGTVDATEEAIVNAMIAAQSMTGADGYRLFGLPHNELREILKRYGRLATPGGR